MKANQDTFFDDFKTEDKAAWVQEALKKQQEQDLKILQSTTYEGITLDLFYTQEDKVDSGLTPADFRQPRHWYNAPEVSTAAEAEQAANNGAEGLKIRLHDNFWNSLAGSAHKFLWADTQQAAPESLPANSTIYYDYLAQMAVSGQKSAEAAANFQKVVAQAEAWGIDGQIFGQAGGNAVQELAFTLAIAAEYFANIEQKESAAQKLQVSLSTGNNYFMEIAKFRALRLLWKLFAKGFGFAPTPLFIHAHTIQWNKTLRDPHNNMLRVTTEAMSALIGGADAISVTPYDSPSGNTSDFSQRIARNVSIILRDESHLDKAVDPAAGAYYIEHLTVSLAQKAWQLFREVEQKGGFSAACEAGFIAESIAEIAEKRKANLENAQDILVGANKYQNKDEKMMVKDHEASIDKTLLKPIRLAQFAEKA